jgi:hypothetical protein
MLADIFLGGLAILCIWLMVVWWRLSEQVTHLKHRLDLLDYERARRQDPAGGTAR